MGGTESRFNDANAWAWAAIDHVGDGTSGTVADEFHLLSSRAQGELATFIQRLTNGRVRRKNLHDLGDNLLAFCHTVDGTHHHIYFALHKNMCVALSCVVASQRRPESAQIAQARQRAKAYLND